MLLKMYCKDMPAKQMIAIGQFTMVLGLGCTSGTILLNRFAHVSDYLLGFLTGFGAVMLGISIVFNITGLKRKKAEE